MFSFRFSDITFRLPRLSVLFLFLAFLRNADAALRLAVITSPPLFSTMPFHSDPVLSASIALHTFSVPLRSFSPLRHSVTVPYHATVRRCTVLQIIAIPGRFFPSFFNAFACNTRLFRFGFCEMVFDILFGFVEIGYREILPFDSEPGENFLRCYPCRVTHILYVFDLLFCRRALFGCRF